MSVGFASVELARLSGPETACFDAVTGAPVTAGCTQLLSDAAQAALEADQQHLCEQASCIHCDQLLCESHYADDGSQPMPTCDGFPAHTACHRQSCTDPACWFDG